jgi:hypothetical protein
MRADKAERMLRDEGAVDDFESGAAVTLRGRLGDDRLRLRRFADALDCGRDLLLRPADGGLRLSDRLVDLAFGSQLVIAGEVANCLFDPALGLIKISVALILVPHDMLQSVLRSRAHKNSMRRTAGERLCASAHPSFQLISATT